ncbi:MAG TPA: hypothetical protein VLB44_01925, partial [Kofleriaceae bacterium]|nr:hypothetical protein [Kofleriaceae bacterium]
GDVPVTVRVRQGVFRVRYLGLGLGVLGIPFLIFGIYGYSFERRRWSNSTEGYSGAPKSPLLLLIGGLALIFGGIIALIKAAGESDD